MRGRPTSWLVVLLAAACAEPGAGRVTETADATGTSFGRLRVTTTVAAEGDPALAVETRLFRFRDLDPANAEILAGGEAPAVDALPAGRCVAVDGEALVDEALGSVQTDTSIQRLDGGDVLAAVGSRRARVVPRYAPDIVPFVSGPLYAAEETTDVAAASDAGGRVTLAGLGGPDVGAFGAEVVLPAAPRIDSASLDRRTGIQVVWSSPDHADAEVVVVSWSSGTDGRPGELRCRALEAGRLTVSPEALAAVLGDATPGDVVIAVERLVRAPLVAPGLDDGEIEVVTRDALPARLL